MTQTDKMIKAREEYIELIRNELLGPGSEISAGRSFQRRDCRQSLCGGEHGQISCKEYSSGNILS